MRFMTFHYLATVRKAGISLLIEWSCGLRRSTVELYRRASYPLETFISALSTYDGGRGVRYVEKMTVSQNRRQGMCVAP